MSLNSSFAAAWIGVELVAPDGLAGKAAPGPPADGAAAASLVGWVGGCVFGAPEVSPAAGGAGPAWGAAG